ncbi:DUF4177 domain-containing protein [Anaerococcus sp. ENR1011]|uniref:DUF4177 domain-containing protein n=1 Tax=Anaerococcus groningensis TaxID=3115616 RepID=A0ABW9N155_9FIRM
MFEYKFEKNVISNGFKESQSNNMDQVEKVIEENANDGWRLSQVLVVPKEKAGLFMINYYQVIFERKI